MDPEAYAVNRPEDEIDLRQYAAILWRRKWLMLFSIVLAAGSALVVSLAQAPVYQATTTLLIDQAPDAQTSDYTALLMSERLARTYAELITKTPVLEETIARGDLRLRAEDLREKISVQPVRDTQLIELSVEDGDPVRAAVLANLLVEVFAEQNREMQASRFGASKESLRGELDRLRAEIEAREAEIGGFGETLTEAQAARLARLEQELAEYRRTHTSLLQSYEELRVSEASLLSNVVQVEPATPPDAPVRPRTLLNTALAAVVGGMLALGAVLLLEYLDDTIKSPQEASARLGLPIAGMIARIDGYREGDPYVAEKPLAPVAEAFRALRTNLEFAAVDRPIKTLLITSPGPEEGKSTVAANLAVVIAQAGKRVILLDADLRRPRIHRLVGMPNRNGLTDAFVRSVEGLNGMVREARIQNLNIVTSGGLPPNPAELLGSVRMRQILDKLSDKADIVILDSPPASVVTDAVILAARVDGVLLVVEPARTRIGTADRAVDQLRRSGANLIGLVFNNMPLGRFAGHSDYYYPYLYSYVAKAKATRLGSRRKVKPKPKPKAPETPAAARRTS